MTAHSCKSRVPVPGHTQRIQYKMLPQLGRCFSKQERQRQEKPTFYLACTWKLPANSSLLKLNLYIHDKSKLSQEHPSFLKTNLLLSQARSHLPPEFLCKYSTFLGGMQLVLWGKASKSEVIRWFTCRILCWDTSGFNVPQDTKSSRIH